MPGRVAPAFHQREATEALCGFRKEYAMNMSKIDAISGKSFPVAVARLMKLHGQDVDDLHIASGLSVKSIMSLLRGDKAPQYFTVVTLSNCWNLTPREHEALTAAAGFLLRNNGEFFRRGREARPKDISWNNETLRQLNAILPLTDSLTQGNVEMMLKRALQRAKMGLSPDHIQEIYDILSPELKNPAD